MSSLSSSVPCAMVFFAHCLLLSSRSGLRNLLVSLRFVCHETPSLYCDGLGAIVRIVVRTVWTPMFFVSLGLGAEKKST